MNWILYAFFGALAASLGTIFAKIGLKGLDSNIVTTVRGIVMAFAVLLFTLTLGKFNSASIKNFDTNTWIFIILSGIAGAASWLLFFYALSGGPAGGVTAIDKLSIVITVVLATILLGERLTLQIGLGAVMMGVGAILIAIPWNSIVSFFK